MAFARPHVVHRAARPVRVAVTGAGSYSGRYISALLAEDANVIELRNFTNHPQRIWDADTTLARNEAFSTVRPLKFHDKDLRESLEGVDVLICTYWTRFSEGEEMARNKGIAAEVHPAVAEVKTLVDAAIAAGVRRIIYVSHTKPGLGDPVPQYIQGKALCEEYIKKAAEAASVTFGFVRPCCIFGDSANESIVVNNTAYLARRLPVLAVPGTGREFFQPVHVRDLAEMCVNLALWPGGVDAKESSLRYPPPPVYLDAVGPEKLTLQEFMTHIRNAVGARGVIVPSRLPPWMLFPLMRPINYILDDVFVERGDLEITAQNLACSSRDTADVVSDVNAIFADTQLNETPLARYPVVDAAVDYNLWGRRRFTEWVREQGAQLGKSYINSYARYYDCSGLAEFKARMKNSKTLQEAGAQKA